MLSYSFLNHRLAMRRLSVISLISVVLVFPLRSSLYLWTFPTGTELRGLVDNVDIITREGQCVGADRGVMADGMDSRHQEVGRITREGRISTRSCNYGKKRFSCLMLFYPCDMRLAL